jgi:hypothetical protein
MAVYTLQPGETRNIQTPSKFLSILELDGLLSVASSSYGLKPLRVKPGWQLELDGIPEVAIENVDAQAVTVELQDAGVKISGGGGGAVSITNKPVIKRIEEPLDFEANVTFNGGAVELISSDNLNTLPDVLCGINTRSLVAPENQVRRTLIIQNQSDEFGVRVGGNQVSANRGFKLEPGATVTLSTRAPVFAYNDNGQGVELALTEL